MDESPFHHVGDHGIKKVRTANNLSVQRVVRFDIFLSDTPLRLQMRCTYDDYDIVSLTGESGPEKGLVRSRCIFHLLRNIYIFFLLIHSQDQNI